MELPAWSYCFVLLRAADVPFTRNDGTLAVPSILSRWDFARQTNLMKPEKHTVVGCIMATTKDQITYRYKPRDYLPVPIALSSFSSSFTELKTLNFPVNSVVGRQCRELEPIGGNMESCLIITSNLVLVLHTGPRILFLCRTSRLRPIRGER